MDWENDAVVPQVLSEYALQYLLSLLRAERLSGTVSSRHPACTTTELGELGILDVGSRNSDIVLMWAKAYLDSGEQSHSGHV